MEGRITRVFKIDSTDKEEHLVIVNKDTTIVYGNMVTIYKKAGDRVHRGELIGKLSNDVDSDRYLLFFGIMTGYKNIMGEELITLLNKYN